MDEDFDYIPLAALNQFSYCPHRCWRMFCAGEFIDNAYTIEGTTLHQRVHSLGESHRAETRQIRAIWLKSERHKLIGKSDLVEEIAGQYFPIEYKRASDGWDNDALQLCAQALCLEEMTQTQVAVGFLYSGTTHQREAIAISPELRYETLATLEKVRTLMRTGTMPLPIYSKRCEGCSLQERCQPRMLQKVSRYHEED
jgi:CRISPR-associated exonuclease Cas4